ncbi:vacuolating cytotoxin domain-containing protein [Helicobacter baculiformis]|uniref:Vacuolating cytotoxin domain-containing protein n=1 Tax=Helicobacter baculiformis TaxID=427351 RepID=A0ABV7ZH10_9HELI|nr:vacuolating cytotoxin domain-containing protein [Helicobacter baculiformis]
MKRTLPLSLLLGVVARRAKAKNKRVRFCVLRLRKVARESVKRPLKPSLKAPKLPLSRSVLLLGVLATGGVLRGQETNVWGGVYWLENKTYNLGSGGVAYIDPGNSTIGTYTSQAWGRSFDVNVTGNNQTTLVIGNKAIAPATGGTIWIPHGSIGPIWGTFNAPNIYLTNTFKTGTPSGSGKGVMSFNASNNLTMDGLTYDNTETIAGGGSLGSGPRSSATFKATNTMDIKNSNFADNTWGTFNLSAKDITLSHSGFTGYHSNISVIASASLQADNMSVNNAYGSVEISGSNGATINNAIFSGDQNSVKLSSTAGNLSLNNTKFSNSQQININAQTASFSNTTFDTTGQAQNVFKANSLTFDNTTWNGSTYYKFEGQNGSSTNTTFSGTTNINTDAPGISPFSTLQGTINLSPGAIINIAQSLKIGQNYILFNDKSTIKSDNQTLNDQDFWKFLTFHGAQATSISPDGANTSIANFNIGGLDYRMKGVLSGGKLTFQMLTGYQNIWHDVYCMSSALCALAPSTPFKTYSYNVGDGIAYIDPNSVSNHFLNAYSSLGNGGTYNVEGQGTLVIGNDRQAVATGGVVQFGAVGNVGYIKDWFNAYNIYLTNTINVGTSALTGGGAQMSFTAKNNLIADGLTYHNYITALPPFNTAIQQHSNALFNAQSISINNSSLEDDSSGKFSFSGSTAVSFNQSNLQGSGTTVTINTPKATLDSTSFFLGNSAGLTFESNSSNGNTAINNSTINLSKNSNATFNTNTTLNSTTMFLNNASQVSFNKASVLSGTTALNLDHSSNATFAQGANLSGNAYLDLINSSKATFSGNTTFSSNASLSLGSQSSATFQNGLTNFEGQAHLSVLNNSNVSNNTTPQVQFEKVNFGGGSSLNLQNATITSKETSFTNQASINMGSSTLEAGTLNLNGGNFLLQNSTIKATTGTSTGIINVSFQGNSQFTFNNAFNLDGTLNFKGLLSSNNKQPLIQVGNSQDGKDSGIFDLKGTLNIANIDLSALLQGNKPITYDIVNAKAIQGITGSEGYKKIDFYGIKITDATYTDSANQKTQSWSFVNPLNGAQTITEKIENGKLTIQISENANPVATSYYNIAPELYFYKQSKQNTQGYQYDYSDDRTGTFFLDGNLKGVFTPKSEKGQSATPIVPGTYDANNQPLKGLYISNSILGKNTIGDLYGIASSLLPKLENLLKSGVLNDLSDPAKAIQALENSGISLTNEQQTQLLNFINGLSSQINQTFKNGTLVVGAPQAGQTGSTSTVWFGGNGYTSACAPTDAGCQALRSTNLGQLLDSTSTAMGYIQAQFNAKDIYITGTVGSGNAWGMGGSANVTFNSATDLTLNGATISAEGTDQIFTLLGQGGLEKLLGQQGLAQMLGQYIYQQASGANIVPNLIPNGIKDSLPAPLIKDLGDKLKNLKLSDFLTAQDMGALLQLPGMETVIKNILSTKTVSSVLGNGGLIYSLSEQQRQAIYNEINKQLPLGGAKIVQDLANGIFGPRTLLNLINALSPMSHMDVKQMLNFPNTPQGEVALKNFLENNTFGKIFEGLMTNADLINKTLSWLGPQILSELIQVAVQDAIHPSQALTNTLGNVGTKIIDQIFGAGATKTLQDLQQQQDVAKVIDALMQGKGLEGIWANGLGSVLPQSLQDALKKVGMGSLLAPKGLSAFWQKGYFNFLANHDVLVSNSTFNNATGGSLDFVAGNQIIFYGTNTINFTNSQGTLNFFSNKTSNIDISALNASNGLDINAQFNNISVQKGTITLTNSYESLGVSAQNFSFLGTIDASAGGSVNLSRVTNNTTIGTLNLGAQSTLSANNLGIATAFNNTSSQVANIAQNFTLYFGSTLTTGPQSIQVGGNFSSAASALTFNSDAKNMSVSFINVSGIATLMPTSATSFTLHTTAPASTSASTSSSTPNSKPTTPTPATTMTTASTPTPQTQSSQISLSTNGVYTLINAGKWIRYSLVGQAFNPNSWQDYLTLYTYLDIDGKSMKLNAQGTGLTYNGKPVTISDDGLSVSYTDAQNQTITTSIAYNKMQVGITDPLSVNVPTIQQYIAQIQGQQSVDAIYNAGGARVMQWLKALLIDTKNTPLFAPYYLEDHSVADLVKIAKDISNSIDLIASPTLKSNSADILQINVYTQQMSRLAKLSNFTPNTPTFADMLESLKGKKFASAVPNAMDVILKYSQRDTLKNNLWMQGVGGASFVAGGTGTLYGINVGYDRFVKGVIVGGYAAYGYSGFHGNIANSNSNNINIGLYSRAFVKRSEITLSASETWGYNKTYISATDPLLSIINQQYDYNTWTTNIGANYGYDFFFKNKSVVLKPQIALRYYYIGLSGLQGTMDNPTYNRFRANADPNKKSVVTLNLALESRHYFGKNSYYFVIADIGRDLFVHSMGDKLVRFIGDNTLSYRNGGLYNTFMALTTGGEIRLWKALYINAGIGARFGLDYQDINITGNVGMRYAF